MKYSTALSLFLQSRKIWESSAESSLKQEKLFNIDIEIINCYSFMMKFDEALDYIESLTLSRIYRNNIPLNNELYSISHRVADKKSQIENLTQTHLNLKTEIEEQLQKDKNKLFEMLSIFSAIIAFIVSSVTLIGRNDLETTPSLLIAVGIILVIFVMTVSLSIERPKKLQELFKDIRIWILMIYLVTAIFLPKLYQSSNEAINENRNQLELQGLSHTESAKLTEEITEEENVSKIAPVELPPENSDSETGAISGDNKVKNLSSGVEK